MKKVLIYLIDEHVENRSQAPAMEPYAPEYANNPPRALH